MVNNTPRNKIDCARLKAMGMVAGVSDMIYIGSNGVVFIEFKTDKGRQTPEQKAFEEQCERLGYEYHVVRSFDTFKTLIES